MHEGASPCSVEPTEQCGGVGEANQWAIRTKSYLLELRKQPAHARAATHKPHGFESVVGQGLNQLCPPLNRPALQSSDED